MSKQRLAGVAVLIAAVAMACGETRRRTPTNGNGNGNGNGNDNNNQPTDAGTNPDSPLRLSVRGYQRPWVIEGTQAPSGQSYVSVEVDVINAGDDAVTIDWNRFSLETDGAVHPASQLTVLLSGRCEGPLDGHARTLCPLYFIIEATGTPRAVVLHRDLGDVRAELTERHAPPMLCAVLGPEHDSASCNDGCNNDGDAYVDCDDADCCGVRFDCAPGTYCGGPQIECVMGIEDSVDSCRDTCDNDEDGYTDCNDFDCCDLRFCGPDTSCGQRPDPFSTPLNLSDGIVASVDPATLPASGTPCHAPALVRVLFARDGDTIEVAAVDATGIDGRVRLIGADTPEIGRDGAPSECYAGEAFDFTRQLNDRLVWLTFDNECFDRFDRYLAYAYFGPHRADMLQRHLLRRGFARRLAFSDTNALGDLMDQDVALAEQVRAGLWSACP